MRSAGGVVTLTLLGLCGLCAPARAGVPVNLLPFINYYEVYLEPYSSLTQKLRGVSILLLFQPAVDNSPCLICQATKAIELGICAEFVIFQVSA